MRMRSGLWGDRSLYVPRRDLIAQAEPVLARLRAERKLGPDAPASEVRAQAAEYLSLMQAPPRPSTAAGLAASGGFLLWIAAALAFIFKAFSKGGFSWGRSWPYAVLFVAGYAVWLAGLIAA
jgi:hypothetical protein